MNIQVWADVGGTFTDCVVVDPDGLRTIKVLSTGVVRCWGNAIDNRLVRVAPLSVDLPDDFWTGAELSYLDSSGLPVACGTIDRFAAQESTVTLKPTSDRPIQLPSAAMLQIDPQMEAPVLAARMLLKAPITDPLPPLSVRMGTTRGTNALLTRSGAATALVITEGFGDILKIGEQDRPELFDLTIKKPTPLTDRVVEVSGRLDAKGNVLWPLDGKTVRTQLQQLHSMGIKSLAICLLHSYLNDEHERLVEEIAREIGFSQISRSSEVAPLIKLVSRAETTTLDAYLNPILVDYVARVWQQFGGQRSCHLRLMTSGGNLVAPDAFRGRDSILSGPAGGVVALAELAKECGVEKAIGLDMGGTSTDVSRFEGRLGRRYESRVGGVRVMTPMMDIETVAAGGGSICDYRVGRLTVGPESAGAEPGPACYGRGGPLTVTDVNLLLGRIPGERFPFQLDEAAAQRRLQQIGEQLPEAQAANWEALADGFLNIAVTHMAEAVRSVSTAEGTDVRAMSLVGFGGAAGQHLCRVADELGITHILDHPQASVLSAVGMGSASIGRVLTHGVYRSLPEVSAEEIEAMTISLTDKAIDQLHSEHATHPPAVVFECDLRYLGTESSLALQLIPLRTLGDRFHAAHQTTFGYAREEREIELVTLRCEATIEPAPTLLAATAEAVGAAPQVTRLWQQSDWVDAQLIDRESLVPGDSVAAPAMVVSDQSTLVVESGWHGTVLRDRTIELTPDKGADPPAPIKVNNADDPVLLEVIARRLQGIADAMGEALRRTAMSVNIKERRDYSCAVFRADGSLVANAPHVPVHLGAMGHTVRRMIKVFPEMSPGDCLLSNDPFTGGSHLPDVTVVTPVFCDSANQPNFFVASRAHHAEIGGRTPGSMPPDATSLAEEGVLIRDFALLKDGVSREPQLRRLLTSGPYPSRSPDENLADIAAQQAAGIEGAAGLNRLAEVYTVATVDSFMQQLLRVAGDNVASWIDTLPTTPMEFSDALDDGTKICVSLRREQKQLIVDFAGTAGVHAHGFNATPAIVTAAVLYVVRCVSGSNLPLCDGVLRDIDLRIEPGLLNPPAHEDPRLCAAVVAGNVETSQRIVDVLLGALGAAAASQGTMNNLLLGNQSFGYYETICGGAGATPMGAGADAVHTHMTNTRITDPEVLESRLPVRLHRFAIRVGSGGAGEYRGGDGIIRELEFLDALTVSLITNRRTTSPYGLGGQPGMSGKNQLQSGTVTTELPPAVTIEVVSGDRLVIQTPGGGGWTRQSAITKTQ